MSARATRSCRGGGFSPELYGRVGTSRRRRISRRGGVGGERRLSRFEQANKGRTCARWISNASSEAVSGAASLCVHSMLDSSVMITPFQKLLNRGLLRLQRAGEIGHFDGITLADTQDSKLFS